MELKTERLNPRFEEYNQYLEEHINGVKRAWEEMLKPNISDWMVYHSNLTVEEIEAYIWEITAQISKHDMSKYSDEEYNAYLNYFYPTENFEKNEQVFDIAWLFHQKRNSHHYQYYILIRDSGETVPIDMPLAVICEMLCDWHSFSAKDPESTAYNWYEKNKDNMLLSDNTVEIVESLLGFLKEPLN